MSNEKNVREPTDPMYIFSNQPASLRDTTDDASFYEVNRESPIDHYYRKEKLKAKSELHILTSGSGPISKDNPILNAKKEIYFPDPLYMKEDIQDLGLNKQSHRFDQAILNSFEIQNELSAIVQAKQINQTPEKPQSKARKKNPTLNIDPLPTGLFQSYYKSLPPDYLASLFMSSPKYAFKAILKGDKRFISQLTDLINKEKRYKFLSKYLSNRSFGFLSLGLYRLAVNDCVTAISIDKYNTFAYYIKGIILLFEKKELNAINVWRTSLQLDYYDHFSLIMKHLIQDHNMRHTLYSLKGNNRELVYFNEKYYTSKIFTSDDVQIGFKKLDEKKFTESLNQFNNVLQVKPQDEESIIGRSITLYGNGDYISATKCLSEIQSIKQVNPEYSKFFGLGFAALHYDTNAVINLSNSIQSNPIDYDSILLRAEIQIERGQYKRALHDLLSLPDNTRTDKVFVLMAECYAWMGKLQKTLDTLRCVSPIYEDSSLYLCHYIVARDHCDYKEAINCIKKAICLNPTFTLIKIAADYFYSNACFLEASSFYQMALEVRRNSPSVLRSLAFSLIHNGNEMEGAKILKNIGKIASGGDSNFSNNLCPSPTSNLNSVNGGWANNMNINYLDQWIYDFGKVEVTRLSRIESRMNPFAPLLKSDKTDYRFILHLMNIIDMPFELAVRDKIVDCGKGRMPFNRNKIVIPNSNSNSSTTINLNSNSEDSKKAKKDKENVNIEASIVNDAEKLGMKCIPITYEVTQNIRVIRALGLAVLYLAHFMRSEMNKMIEIENQSLKVDSDDEKIQTPNFVISHWTKPFDDIRAILQIADFQIDVKWISCLASAMQHPASVVSSPPPNECFGFVSRNIGTKPSEESQQGSTDEKSNTNQQSGDNNSEPSTNPLNSTQIPESNSTSEQTDTDNNNDNNNDNPEAKKEKKRKKIKKKVIAAPAPFKRQLRPYTGSPFEDQFVDTQVAPCYFIQNGVRRPPRFQHISKSVFEKLAYTAKLMVSDQHRKSIEFEGISKSAKYLYQAVQKDITLKWKYDTGKTLLLAPTLSLKYLGALGYEVYVAPPLLPKYRMRYYMVIEDCWTELIKGGSLQIHLSQTKQNQANNNNDSSNNNNNNTSGDNSFIESPDSEVQYRNQGQLTMMLLMLWMLHPFSFYSPEVGHIVLHAYVLACSNEEIEKIDQVDELFITQMVNPDRQKLRSIINNALKNRTKSSINPESLSFWDDQKSLRDVMNLIGS